MTPLPRQRTGGWAEAAVVPLVALERHGAGAAAAVAGAPRPRALGSMGNGQWLAFTREICAASGGHDTVRGDVLGDVQLARRARAAGARLVVALAPRTLEVRMYCGWREVRDGFRKNLYPLLRGGRAPFVAGVALFSLAAVYPWVAAERGTSAALGRRRCGSPRPRDRAAGAARSSGVAGSFGLWPAMRSGDEPPSA